MFLKDKPDRLLAYCSAGAARNLGEVCLLCILCFCMGFLMMGRRSKKALSS